MEQMKMLAMNLCIVTLCFALFRAVLPCTKYEKYVGLLLKVTFLLILLGGVRKTVTDTSMLNFDNTAAVEGVNIDAQLAAIVQGYINDTLEESGYPRCCISVKTEIIEHQGRIQSVTIAPTVQQRADVLQKVKEITGLEEEKIYVSME